MGGVLSRQQSFCNFISHFCAKAVSAGLETAVNPRKSAIFGMVEAEKTVPDDFGSQVKSAFFWRSGSQILSQLIAWSSTLIVIRVLGPASYGLLAMTQVLVALLSALAGYGFARALVQAESVTPKLIRQTVGLLLLLNLSMAAAQIAIAPLMAAYYNEPLVADILRWQVLLYLANPVMITAEVLLSRELRFKPIALVNLGTALVGAMVALGCALAGMGVWSLVYAPIAAFWTRAIGLAIAARLVPVPSFDFRGSRDMIVYGTTLLGSHLLVIVQTQSDVFFAGRRFDPHAIGLYSEALFMAQLLINKFIPSLNDVAFPAYTQIQKDAAAVRWNFLKSLRLIFLVAAPVFIGLAVTAEPAIVTLIGRKWVESAPYVTMLALAMPFMAFHALLAPLNNALGRPGLTVQSNLIGVIVFPLCFLIGLNDSVRAAIHAATGLDGEMTGVAMAWLIAAPLLAWGSGLLTRRIVGFSFADVIRAIGVGMVPAVIMGIIVAIIARILPPLPAPVTLAILAASGAILYMAQLWIFNRPAIDEVLSIILRRKAQAAPAT